MTMREKTKCGAKDSSMSTLKLGGIDPTSLHMTGDITDKIFDKNGKHINTIESHNLVVNSFLNLVMCLLKHESGYSGIQYWAIGEGLDTWDDLDEVPSPGLGETTLVKEIGRMPIDPSAIVFLNNDFTEITTPSNIIQITHTFGVNDCNGKWREFGIFGGNATTDADSGLMINKRNHQIITKNEEMIIERTMRFTLNLV